MWVTSITTEDKHLPDSCYLCCGLPPPRVSASLRGPTYVLDSSDGMRWVASPTERTIILITAAYCVYGGLVAARKGHGARWRTHPNLTIENCRTLTCILFILVVPQNTTARNNRMTRFLDTKVQFNADDRWYYR